MNRSGAALVLYALGDAHNVYRPAIAAPSTDRDSSPTGELGADRDTVIYCTLTTSALPVASDDFLGTFRIHDDDTVEALAHE